MQHVERTRKVPVSVDKRAGGEHLSRWGFRSLRRPIRLTNLIFSSRLSSPSQQWRKGGQRETMIRPWTLLSCSSYMGGVLLLSVMACAGPTQPAGVTQPLSGTITLENQQNHSWISIVLTGPDTVIVATDSDGSYSLPMLEDGLWSVVIWLALAFPKYLPSLTTYPWTISRLFLWLLL